MSTATPGISRDAVERRVLALVRPAFIVFLLVISLFPFYYMVLLSFRPLDAVLQDPGALWPDFGEIDFDTYKNVLQSTADGGQGFLNFITNSIKFSRPGDTLRIEIQKLDTEILILISDTGIGIPASELPHIFDRFYKADKARNRARSGSGLGLSIAQKIIELHQGGIDVQSEVDKGTTFTVRLPRL